jgi:hypothetical protein
MSREFGSYTNGYFHDQMKYAAEDLGGSGDPLSRLWGKFFDEFYHVAYAISSSEACDSGRDRPILETIERIDRLKKVLWEIEQYVRPYKDVAETAVRRALEKKEPDPP